jgi:hypothetical protein
MYYLVFYCNHTFIVHRFRYNGCFVNRKYVIALSPLGGAVGDLYMQILKDQPRLHIRVALTFFVYLEPFRSYSTLFIWLGFPYWGKLLGGKMTL